MTNLDPKHIDALVDRVMKISMDLGFPSTTTMDSALARELCATITALRAENDRLSNLWQIEHDHATALRAQIDRERAATIEAAASWCETHTMEIPMDHKKRRYRLYSAGEPTEGGVYEGMGYAAAIRELHTDATRAAMDAIRRDGYEAGVKEAAKLYEDGGGPGVGGWDYFGDFYDALLALAASITPDPDTTPRK